MCPTLFKIPWLDVPIRGYGLMLMIAFLGGTWWASQRAARVKANADLVVNLGFVALISSVIGARIFYVAHYWDRFAGKSLWEIVNLTAGGLEFYGGFIGAFVKNREIFHFAHIYVWQTIFILFVVCIWLLWIEKVVKRGRGSQVEKAADS